MSHGDSTILSAWQCGLWCGECSVAAGSGAAGAGGGSGAGPPCCARWSVLLQGCIKLSWQEKVEVCAPSCCGCVTRAPSKMSITA